MRPGPGKEKRMSRTKNGRAVAGTKEIAILLALLILFHYLFPIFIIVAKPYAYLGIALMLLGLALPTPSHHYRTTCWTKPLRGGKTKIVYTSFMCPIPGTYKKGVYTMKPAEVNRKWDVLKYLNNFAIRHFIWLFKDVPNPHESLCFSIKRIKKCLYL